MAVTGRSALKSHSLWRRVLIGCGFLALIATFLLAWGACSVPEVGVVNDTGSPVRLLGCAEMGILDANQSREIRPESPCLVLSRGGSYLGCLDFPDSAFLNEETVAVSSLNAEIAMDDCTRSDDYNRLTWIQRHWP